VLGIFGRQGVFSANEWPLASKEPFHPRAMAMYRNYDGKGSTFGDMSVSATNTTSKIRRSTPARIPRPDGLTLVALNKTSQPIFRSIALNNTGSRSPPSPSIN